MSVLDDPRIRDILAGARVKDRGEREGEIVAEFDVLGAKSILALTLQQYFEVDTLAEIPESEFNRAALMLWSLIYQFRYGSLGSKLH